MDAAACLNPSTRPERLTLGRAKSASTALTRARVTDAVCKVCKTGVLSHPTHRSGRGGNVVTARYRTLNEAIELPKVVGAIIVAAVAILWLDAVRTCRDAASRRVLDRAVGLASGRNGPAGGLRRTKSFDPVRLLFEPSGTCAVLTPVQARGGGCPKASCSSTRNSSGLIRMQRRQHAVFYPATKPAVTGFMRRRNNGTLPSTSSSALGHVWTAPCWQGLF